MVDATKELHEWHLELWPPDVEPHRQSAVPLKSAEDPDVTAWLEKDDYFCDLYTGNWPDSHREDNSNGDFDLALRAVYYFNRDRDAAIEFMKSAPCTDPAILPRNKPEKLEKHKNYIAQTVDKALKKVNQGVTSAGGVAFGDWERMAEAKREFDKIDTSGPVPLAPETKSKLKILSLSAFEPRRVDYLFEPYIPKASLSICAGQSGAGKTFVLLRLAADVTVGRAFMTDTIITPDRKPQKVLYQSRENDFNTVIRPRFDMMGGNLENFITIDDHDEDGKGAPLSMSDPRL